MLAMRSTTTGDGSRTLHSERYGQSFHSLHGAVTEARHVYLEASGVASRLQAGLATRVLEVGFGTGLNCFLTADTAIQSGARLEIISLERELLPAGQVRELAFDRHLEQQQVLERYLEFRDSLPCETPCGAHRVDLSEHVTLELRLGQAELQQLPPLWADAVYHDAFSPDVNQELWTPVFLSGLFNCLKPGGALVTYSVKGEVRRRLKELGFAVERIPGPPGGKRQMLVAVKP